MPMTTLIDDETEVIERVAQLINERDPQAQAEVWDSGGGIYGILMPVSKRRHLFFGTADVTWGGDLTDEHGEYLNAVNTDCPSDESSPARIASAILTAATLYRDEM